MYRIYHFDIVKYETYFHNVNLQMENGEILTILGANGAGKSTLLNCLANILEPYSGKILVNGASIHDMSLKKLHS